MSSTITKSGFYQSVVAFARDERGSNMIEMAFVTLFFAVFAGSMGWVMGKEDASTQVGKITGSVSDILAQSPVVNTDIIDATFKAGDAMLGNNMFNQLELFVAGIEIDASGNATVLWSRGRCISQLSQPTPGQDYTNDIPARLLNHSGFIVASHGMLKHVSSIDQPGMEASTNFEYKNFFIPRVSVETACTDCNRVAEPSCG